MPLFEFECDRCGCRRDVLCLSSVEADSTPPLCSTWLGEDGKGGVDFCAGTLHRVPSAPAVHFSGNGWTPKHYTK